MAGEGLKQSHDVFPDNYKAGTPKAVPIPAPEKSFDKAMNPPNNPTKDSPPTHYNPNFDYPTYGRKGNPDTGGH